MYPILIKFWKINIYSYGFMLALAFIISSYLIRVQARKEKIEEGFIANLCFGILIAGIIGARLLYILLNIEYFKLFPLEIFLLNHGGLAFYGGLISAIVWALFYIRKKRHSFLRIADLVIPYVALAQAIGRIGCFLNGCCYGKETYYGIYFPVHDKILHPTQLYSSFSLVAIFLILRRAQEKPHIQGRVLFLYLLLYGLNRFAIEFLRNDSQRILFSLTLFQWISLFLIVLSLVLLCLINNAKGINKS